MLAIDQKLEEAKDGEPELVQVVTLEVEPPGGRKAHLRAHKGRLQLALRNPSDHEVVETQSVDVEDMLADRKKAAAPRSFRGRFSAAERECRSNQGITGLGAELLSSVQCSRPFSSFPRGVLHHDHRKPGAPPSTPVRGGRSPGSPPRCACSRRSARRRDGAARDRELVPNGTRRRDRAESAGDGRGDGELADAGKGQVGDRAHGLWRDARLRGRSEDRRRDRAAHPGDPDRREGDRLHERGALGRRRRDPGRDQPPRRQRLLVDRERDPPRDRSRRRAGRHGGQRGRAHGLGSRRRFASSA